jgi:serine/threonine protein kinase
VSLAQGDVVQRAEAKVGNLLHGKYRLERLLGVGGMAAVYEATHRNSKRFAVKVLHPELSLQNDVRTRFLREGYAATQVNHPGAVSVLDDDVAEDGSAFLVMELLKGTTMDSLWERYEWQMATGPVLAIGYQLLDVLAAAHSRGIVHRDIKPENLFLTTEGQVKVLDFGIARLQETAHSSSLTGTGFVMGTPSFMAPEQALGRSSQVDAQSDVWSAGAALFTLLSGHYVHEGESPQAIVVQCATQPARSLDEVLPNAPAELVHLIDRALAFKKPARWQTALEMQAAVVEAGRAAGVDVTSREVLVRLLAEAPSGERTSIVPDHVTIARGQAPEPGTPVTTRRRTTGASEAADAGTLAEAGAGLDEPRESRPLREPPKRIGLTTEQPVARDSPVPAGALGWLTRHKSIGAAAAGGVVVALGFALARGRGTADDARASAVPAREVSSLGASAAAAAPPGVAEPAQALAAPAGTTTTVDLNSLLSVPSSSEPAPAAAASAEARHPLAPHRAPGAGSAPAAAAPAAHAQTDTNCNPPFTIDPVSGKKKWKAECL